jgi:hypothetical protein
MTEQTAKKNVLLMPLTDTAGVEVGILAVTRVAQGVVLDQLVLLRGTDAEIGAHIRSMLAEAATGTAEAG